MKIDLGLRHSISVTHHPVTEQRACRAHRRLLRRQSAAVGQVVHTTLVIPRFIGRQVCLSFWVTLADRPDHLTTSLRRCLKRGLCLCCKSRASIRCVSQRGLVVRLRGPNNRLVTLSATSASRSRKVTVTQESKMRLARTNGPRKSERRRTNTHHEGVEAHTLGNPKRDVRRHHVSRHHAQAPILLSMA